MSVRNRGVWRIDEEDIARAVRLPEGQRVIGVRENWPMLSIDVMIEGSGLPDVQESQIPPYIGRGLPDVDLKRRIESLADELERAADELTDDHEAYGYRDSADRLRELVK